MLPRRSNPSNRRVAGLCRCCRREGGAASRASTARGRSAGDGRREGERTVRIPQAPVFLAPLAPHLRRLRIQGEGARSRVRGFRFGDCRGVVVTRGRKEAWSKFATRRTGTGYDARPADKRADDREFSSHQGPGRQIRWVCGVGARTCLGPHCSPARRAGRVLADDPGFPVSGGHEENPLRVLSCIDHNSLIRMTAMRIVLA